MRIPFVKRRTPENKLKAFLGLSAKEFTKLLEDAGIFEDIRDDIQTLYKNVGELNTNTRRVEKRQYRWFAANEDGDDVEVKTPRRPPRDNGNHPLPDGDGLQYLEPRMP
jgi:tRNA A37 N6-isopentenylltransferase MiaA